MSIDLASDLWGELKRFINNMDKHEAADVLVNLLIDNDHDIEDIRQAFKGDPDIKKALESYIDDTEEDYEEDDTDDPDDPY